MTNQVDYFEVASPDPARSKSFYGGLFGWSFGDTSPGAYLAINGGAGGLWDTTAMGGATWAIFYVHVDDVSDAVSQAVALGATVAVPLVDNGQIEFAHLIDLDGNRFAVWRPKS